MQMVNAVASETLTVTDYRGHRQTLLPVREINLKACTPIILKQFIQPSWGLNPGPADNRFRLSAHCANEPQRQAKENKHNIGEVWPRKLGDIAPQSARKKHQQ